MKKIKITQLIAKGSILAIIVALTPGLLSFSTTSTIALATGENLVSNPSLEIETIPGIPDGWQSGAWPETTTANFEYPLAGTGGTSTKAVKTTVSAYGTQGDAKWYFNDVTAKPETYYIYSDQYLANTPTNIYVRYNLGKNSENVDIYEYIVLGQAPASSSWQNYSAEFLTPTSTVSITVFHALEGVGELAIDDVSLTERLAPETFAAGMVTLSFDDGWKSTYDNALPILDAKGFKSTHYIISDMIQTDRVNGYITSAELLNLNNTGHEIGAHSKTHSALISPPLTPAKQLEEIAGSRLDLLAKFNIKPVDSLAFPYGQYDETTKSLAKQAGFVGARTVDDGFNEVASDRFALKTLAIVRGGLDTSSNQMIASTTIEEVQSAIDTAINNKAWLIFALHQVDYNDSNIYGTTPEFLQTIADFLDQRDVAVKTMSEALSLMPNVPAKDVVAPTIATSTNIYATTTDDTKLINFTLPLISDDNDTETTPYCSSASGLISGSVFPLGDTLITCQAADSSGNIATTTSFTINLSKVENKIETTTPPVVTPTRSGSSGGSYWLPLNKQAFTGYINWTEPIKNIDTTIDDYVEEAKEIINFTGDITLSQANLLLYNNLINKRTPISTNLKRMLSYFIQNGTTGTKNLSANERAGVLDSYYNAYGKFPQELNEWKDVLKIINGRWTMNINKKTEQKAITLFTYIYRRLPNFKIIQDETAIKLIAYGIRPGKRELKKEEASLKIFYSLFDRLPRAAGDWNIIRAIAYSGARR